MTDPGSEQDFESSDETTSDSTSRPRPRPKTPRWVWIAVALVAAVLVVFLVSLLMDGGKHGPSRHMLRKHSIFMMR